MCFLRIPSKVFPEVPIEIEYYYVSPWAARIWIQWYPKDISKLSIVFSKQYMCRQNLSLFMITDLLIGNKESQKSQPPLMVKRKSVFASPRSPGYFQFPEEKKNIDCHLARPASC